MNVVRVRVKYEEWLTLIDVDNDEQALKIAHDVTVDNYGERFADYCIFETEPEREKYVPNYGDATDAGIAGE